MVKQKQKKTLKNKCATKKNKKTQKSYKSKHKLKINPKHICKKHPYLTKQQAGKLHKNFIIKKDGTSLKKNEVKQDFTNWYQTTYGSGCPRPSELYSYLEKKLGTYPSKPRSNGQRGWENYTILRDEIYE